MGHRLFYKEDEHIVDFADTTEFAIQRWDDAIQATELLLSPSDGDLKKLEEPRTWQAPYTEIRKRMADPRTLPESKRQLSGMHAFPQTLKILMGTFAGAVKPNQPDFNMLWGLAHLNVILSCASKDRLARTAGWTKRLQRVIDLFNRCLEICEDMNDARMQMVDVLDLLLQILGESVRYLRHCPTEAEATKAWKPLEAKINGCLSEMDSTVKHLNDIISYSKVNQERKLKLLANRHAPSKIPEESATFPIKMIPRGQNEDFYGRQEELDKINNALDPRKGKGMRTYTTYGRRGVGKTDLALQYTYINPAEFDAVFWIQCETSITLRQSFTDVAVELNLPGADRNGHHEENQLAVLRWLKTTSELTGRQWLLVFDNAEREEILRGYWPVGASGAILITSRSYHNFNLDAQRQGDTVKPFNTEQSWDLLMKLLGPDWQDRDQRGLMKPSEAEAAKELLSSLGGLALAIQQAAQLILNPNIGDRTIASTLKSYKTHKDKLPPRPTMQRSDIVHALDSLWSITFSYLSDNARDLLSVLSLLSPDGILIDLFLPKNQKALNGKLAFCKQHPHHIDPESQATLSSVITAPFALRKAINELVKFRLIAEEGRELWAHRVVQEAMNYNSSDDVQGYFDSATALVFEAFPKQLHGDYMSSQWGACQAYISHGAHLGRVFNQLRKVEGGEGMKGTENFIDLLHNCAWYLYEVSDYDVCLGVTNTARQACNDLSDTESLRYAGICNVAGGAQYELNKLHDCRQNWETFLNIHEAILPEDSLERSSSYHNMGNLEFASDNLEVAEGYFTRAVTIRKRGGDAASTLLANSFLCLSRIHYKYKKYDTAFRTLGDSEALFVRTSGPEAHFMAHVHFAYGNIEFAQKRWPAAMRAYHQSLKIALATAAIHPITAAAYYSLGCVEFERKHYDNARNWLDKAMAIAQLRSPSRDDGTMARILWKTSVVIYESDTYGTYQDEANAMRIRAEVARSALTDSGEGGVGIASNDDGDAERLEEEDSYDALVPGFFR